jgi:hypothetical protein
MICWGLIGTVMDGPGTFSAKGSQANRPGQVGTGLAWGGFMEGTCVNRRGFLGGMVAFFLGLAGCRKSNKTPGQLSKAEFEDWLAKTLGMTELSLTAQGQGQFTGTGKKNGRTYQIKATQEARQVSWEIKYEGQGRSETSSGSRSW